MLLALQLLIKLIDLAVSKVEFLFSPLDIGQDVVVRLVRPLNQAFVKLDFSLGALKFLLECLDLLEHTLSFFLLLLKAISQE